jgi:hypothetical protein
VIAQENREKITKPTVIVLANSSFLKFTDDDSLREYSSAHTTQPYQIGPVSISPTMIATGNTETHTTHGDSSIYLIDLISMSPTVIAQGNKLQLK